MRGDRGVSGRLRGHLHLSGSARPGPPRDRPVPPAAPPPPKWRALVLVFGLVASLALLTRPTASKPHSFTYSALRQAVAADQVATASIDVNGHVSGTLKKGGHYTSQIPVALRDDQLAATLEQHGVQISGHGPQTPFISVLLGLLPFVLFFGVFLWLGRRTGRQLAAGIGGIGKSRAKVYDAVKPSTRFSDIAGYEGAKLEVGEVVDFLKYPSRYASAGAIGPKGLLMVGPPGTGKTLMARAVAGEAGVDFLSVTGSGFVEMFVGVGASRVRDLFADARKRAPSIVFIDEIDAIGQRRGAMFSNDEREQTLNQLLAELDGFDPTTGVVVIAATNRPETLDVALLRPGRFDRQVEIPLPKQAERAAILAVHGRDKQLGPDVDLVAVARATPGFSGADLANLVNEAAIVAVRAARDVISAEDFSEARDRILLGRRDAVNALLPAEKHAVAVHEAGHALVAALSEHADPVAKVTILPAGRALGVTEQLPVDERHLYPESYLLDSLAVRMGGRAAELIVLGEASTGAANDLAGATELGTRMVRDFGMSGALGPVGFSAGSPLYLGTEEVRSRPYAEATQRVMDEEVSRLLRHAEQRALNMLTQHRDGLDRLIDTLLERETIDGADVDAALRSPPTPSDQPRNDGPPLTLVP
ncbi:MAG TPA: ATP-dependent zinc metalloprotease FtsH [Acidimicrobiia bacterium]|nr:ATP-dependent zinc metalloprotease FtsH [Acidimicrobiia bacterium]